ncbi:MAG: 16S rRNA (uracil(1498)-N(3))-methyltransferase [Candidatus Sumerlaeota bacterium]
MWSHPEKDRRINADGEAEPMDFISGARMFYCPEAAGKYAKTGKADFLVHLMPEEAHHCTRVLRLQSGDHVRLFDGAGYFYDGQLLSVDRKHVSVEVNRRMASRAETRCRLIMLVAMLKGKKVDLVIQKAVELGVAELRFFPAHRSVARISGAKGEGRERWDGIVINACKQCGRAECMPVLAYDSLDAALGGLPDHGARYVFWEELAGETLPKRHDESGESRKNMVAMIGPEGGFTSEEIERVQAAGFQQRSLGPRILRAETAAIVAASILLHENGEI